MAKKITITIETSDTVEFKPLYRFLSYLKSQFELDGASVKSITFQEGKKINVYNINGQTERMDALILNTSQEI